MDYLQMDLNQYAKELHHPARRVKEFRKVIVPGLDATWAIDLVDFTPDWMEKNDGYRYAMVVMDVFSRFCWVEPLKTKDAPTTWKAFNKILTESKRCPHRLWADQGSEFKGVWTSQLKQRNIELYNSYGTHKSMMVERLNKTLKNWTWQYFTEHNTRRWIDVMPELVARYNSRVHRSIGMTPTDVSDPKVERQLWQKQFGYVDESIQKPKFRIGDAVRISRIKGQFEHGFHPNWSYQVYRVKSIRLNKPVSYTLEDWNGDAVLGAFYEPELQACETKDVYLIEKVIKEKTVKGKKQYLVHWLGWESKYDSWVDASDMMKLK